MSRILLGLLGEPNSVALKERRAFCIYGPYYFRLKICLVDSGTFEVIFVYDIGAFDL